MEFDIPSDEYTMMSSNEPILLAQFTKTQLNNDQNRDKGERGTHNTNDSMLLMYPDPPPQIILGLIFRYQIIF